jgi:Cu+-exporting ATPase
MVRRDFIQKIAAGSGTAIAASAKPSNAGSTVGFMVKGFTCVTCAVGLEVVLRGVKGISHAKATYPEGKVTVVYDPAVHSVEKIRAFINKTTGFQVTRIL